MMHGCGPGGFWIAAVLCGSLGAAYGGETPSSDPSVGQAAVAFTVAWAAGLRNVRSLRALQDAAGAVGRIAAIEDEVQAPRVVYQWDGAAGRGKVRAFVYKNGGFAAIVSPADSRDDILLNSSGAFVCPSCSPPVAACGSRPPWVPHDLHWDTFDCAYTITGPQGLYEHGQ